MTLPPQPSPHRLPQDRPDSLDLQAVAFRLGLGAAAAVYGLAALRLDPLPDLVPGLAGLLQDGQGRVEIAELVQRLAGAQVGQVPVELVDCRAGVGDGPGLLVQVGVADQLQQQDQAVAQAA